MKQIELNNMLDKYVDTFIESLDHHAVGYKLIGSGTHESPMWFQYTGIEDGFFMFKSSQKSLIWFSVRVDEEDMEDLQGIYNKLYEYFRKLKYDYLSENHPTIYKEIKG